MLSDEELAKLAQAARERIDVTERWRDVEGRAFDLDDACWFESSPKGVVGYLTDGTQVSLPRSMEIGRLERHAQQRRMPLARTHHRVLVNVRHVRSVQRADDGYRLHFGPEVPPAPVSETFTRDTAIQLGTGQTLDHLTPPSPYTAAIEDLDLLFLGEDEAERIEPGDTAAAEAWRAKWWIENFDEPTMRRYFKEKTTNRLDKTKIIRNGIWQRYMSVKWGVWEPDYGDTRSFYYHPVEDILARHNLRSTSRDKNDPDAVSAHLRDFVIKYKLFDYADFDIPDPNPNRRGVGDRHPHLVVFAEKEGFIKVLMQLAKPYGASYCAVRGEPSAHAMEVFARDLKGAIDVTRRTVHVFGITDLNPGGASIAETLVEDLQAFGIPRIRYHTLVDPPLFEPWRITNFRKQLITYRQDKEGGRITIVGNDTLSYLTKAREWYKRVLKSDTRFLQVRTLSDGRIETSIYGLQANSANPDRLRRRFHDAIAPYLDAPPPDPGVVTAARGGVPTRRSGTRPGEAG